jgi:hypothetical protein
VFFISKQMGLHFYAGPFIKKIFCMKILYLTVEKKWFDQIAAGTKKQEYRELKPYWINRLCWHEYHNLDPEQLKELIAKGINPVKSFYYDAIAFTNGYSHEAINSRFFIKLTNITIGPAAPSWIATDDVFILHLGEVLPLEKTLMEINQK